MEGGGSVVGDAGMSGWQVGRQVGGREGGRPLLKLGDSA